MLKLEIMKEYYKDMDLEMLNDNLTLKEKVFRVCYLDKKNMIFLVSELIYINELIKTKI